jgi:hypothetical protein
MVSFEGRFDGRYAVISVLRQQFNTFQAEELDAVAEDLVRLIRAGTPWQSYNAYMALIHAAAQETVYEGVPYTAASGVFIKLYESYEGEDRLGAEADRALYGVFETGGVAYVRTLFEASEEPPTCRHPAQQLVMGPDGQPQWEEVENPCPNVSAWCQAGRLLVEGGVLDQPVADRWRERCQRIRR